MSRQSSDSQNRAQQNGQREPEQKEEKEESKPTQAIPQQKKKGKKVFPIVQGYTQAQKIQFQALLKKYQVLKVQQLKKILEINNQSRSSMPKNELMKKCADGKLLGRIPRCPECGGGRLKYNNKSGTYQCPGYWDDEEFVKCHKRYEEDQIIREPWIEP